jgi:hypothetical protein
MYYIIDFRFINHLMLYEIIFKRNNKVLELNLGIKNLIKKRM